MISEAKLETEIDYAARTPGGVSFSRDYNSNAYLRDPGSVPGSLIAEDYWNHNYGSRLFGISGTSTPVTVVRRPNGEIQYFDGNGIEILNQKGAADRLQSIPGVGWNLTLANKDVETFGLNGRLTSITSRAGVVQTLAYDLAGRLASVTDTFGSQLVFGYDTSDQLVSVTLPDASAIYYGYDSGGRLIAVTYPDSTTRQYVYDDPNGSWLLTGVIDESNSRYSTFAYDSQGRAIRTEHAGGVDRYTFAYGALDPSGVSVSATDALGTQQGAMFYTSNGVFRPSYPYTSAATRDSPYAYYSYDANGNVSARYSYQIAGGFGLFTTYQYDLTRNLETSRTEGRKTISGLIWTSSATRTITTQWHPVFRSPTQIEVYAGETATGTPRRRTTWTYDSAGNVLTRTITDTTVTPNVARTWTYTYNAFGQVLTEDGPRTDASDVTTYTYYNCSTGSQCGQVNTITNALGHTVTYNSYNAHGQPTQSTDMNGLTMTLGYDLRQRLTDRCLGSTLPGCASGELTHLDYWPTGLLKKVTNPDGSFVEYTYDAAHRLTQIQDGALNKIVYTLDVLGNRTAENTYDPSNALRRTHTRVFNTLNQLWKDVNAAGTANVTTVFGYDNNGNQTSVNSPLSRNSTTAYDYLHRVSQITDPVSGNTLFGYDVNDNLTSVTDPRSLVTSYTYTGFGDLKTQTSPDTGLTTNVYDSGGNLDTSTDSRGAITDYNYDAANRVTSASFTKSGVTDQTVSYAYDAGTNQKGHLTSASDGSHTLAWTYDTKGRITGKGQTVGGTTLAIGYGYNASGQLSSNILPSGATLTFGYNPNGQVTSLTLNGVTTILSGITYDPFGPINGWTWGNGTGVTRNFDTDGKVTQIDTGAGANLKTYAYDDAFRITGISDAGNSALSWTYGYDALDRLNAASKTGTTQGWTYDANGNRLTETGTTPSTYTNAGSSNRVSSITGSLPRTYAYDTAGNTLSYAGATFTYNNRGRMASASNGGVTATYIYNALGQRIARTASSVTTLYAYDEAGHLAGEYTGAGALIQETVWLGDIPVATLRPNGSGGVIVYYVHADHLNTPRLVTDTGNNIRWRWDSDPFGAAQPNENPASLGVFQFNLRFPGQQYDPVVGLHYNYFRDYDPAVGRYAESDLIGLRGGTNTYAYANGDPALQTDPRGLLVSGEWIRSPKFNIADVGTDGWNLAAPSWSWWGYLKFVRIYGHASGFINVDVKCKDECREWEIHDRISVDAHGQFDFGLNVYAAAAKYATGSWLVWGAANFLAGSGAALDAEHHFLSLAQQKAGSKLRFLNARGPTGICLLGVAL
ncbi:MAG: RHS repeat-associated core domain-containing protein [Pseudomonadota bacterium]